MRTSRYAALLWAGILASIILVKQVDAGSWWTRSHHGLRHTSHPPHDKRDSSKPEDKSHPSNAGSGGGGGGGKGDEDKTKGHDVVNSGAGVASVFGAGCRWDPTTANIVEVSFQFQSGAAPPSDWYDNIHRASMQQAGNEQSATESDPATKPDTKPSVRRRDGVSGSDPDTTPANPVDGSGVGGPAISTADPSIGTELKSAARHDAPNAILDSSFHSGLIDVLTFRARYGSFGSSLNSAGCALPAISERLAELEKKEEKIINDYMARHVSDQSSASPSAMFFWAGISNYDPKIKSDLIQTVVFYGDGCAADPATGLCIYSANFASFRYSAQSHMCMGSELPLFVPIDEPVTVIYSTQRGFRTQESWIDGRMINYLRSAGNQKMNSFVITQECKACVWPITGQRYSNIRIKFSQAEPGFDKLGACTGGAKASTPVPSSDYRVWTIDEVVLPAGKPTPDSNNFWGVPTPTA